MKAEKRNLVFFQAVMSRGLFVMEKTKNENLIVHAGCVGNHFSFFEFPDSLPDMAFDPEYAERVANSGNGTFSLVGWTEADDNFHPIYFRAYLTTLQNFVFAQDVKLPIGDAAFAYDGLLPLPDGSVFQISPWACGGDWDAMQAAISAAQKRRDSVPPKSMPEPAAVSSPASASASKFLRKVLQLDTATGEVSVVDQEPPHGDPREPSPEAASAANHVYEILESGIAKRSREGGPLSDAAPQCFGGLTDIFPSLKTSSNATPDDAGQPPPPAGQVPLPPGFVAVPLPDDGEPVLGFKRKPGHYLTRGGYFVDLTYNVGTGIGQHEFPWVHFDKHRRGNRYDVFFTVHGEAYQATRVGSGVFPLCHYDHLPDFDIVQKCVHPAAEECGEELKAGAKFVVTPDQPLQAVVPVEHYNQATGQFSKFRGEVGQAFAMLAKAFGVCECRCGESRKAGS